MTYLLSDEEDLRHKLQTAPRTAVWGYVRVSSQKQEDGFSLEAQRDAILAYCAEVGLEMPYAIVHESASAGAPLFNVSLPGMRTSGPSTPEESARPLLAALLAGITERVGAQLVIWKLDRLARVAMEQDMFHNLLKRHSVSLHVAYQGERHLLNDGDLADDPVRKLMRQVLACFAEYERRLIHMRMRMGAAKKAAKGGWLGGHVPYGYTPQAGELVIVPDQARRVRLVFYLRYAGHYSYKGIYEALNQHLPEGEKPWHKVRVMRVLRMRALYEGLYEDPSGGKHARPDLQILPANWEANPTIILSQEQPLTEGLPT